MTRFYKVLIFAGVYIVLGTITGIMLVGIIHVSHSTIQSNWVTGSDCPFMSHEESLCPMDIGDHVSAMRSLFETVLPIHILVGLLLCCTILIPHNTIPKPAVKPFFTIRTLLRLQQYTIYRFSYRMLQIYFARGILNPKVYQY